jgi:lipase chaperone LimK
VGILLVVAGGVWLAVGPLLEQDRPVARATGSPERSEAPGSTAPSASARPGVDPGVLRDARGSRPASLAGTDVDGGLSVDTSGHFRPDADALALFDYFLAATGEEPDAVIRQRILDEIHHRLAPPADAEAVAFLDRYLGYREAVRTLAESGGAQHDLERRLQWLRELRRDHFGADAEALFGTSEATLLVDLERRRVWTDPDLGPSERDERLALLEESLPEHEREARRRARAPTRVGEEVRRLRAEGADAREVFAVREEAFGSEAALRLAALDEERARWDARFDAYQVEREALLTELGNDPGRYRARLDALRREHFEEEELLRVRVLDDSG